MRPSSSTLWRICGMRARTKGERPFINKSLPRSPQTLMAKVPWLGRFVGHDIFYFKKQPNFSVVSGSERRRWRCIDTMASRKHGHNGSKQKAGREKHLKGLSRWWEKLLEQRLLARKMKCRARYGCWIRAQCCAPALYILLRFLFFPFIFWRVCSNQKNVDLSRAVILFRGDDCRRLDGVSDECTLLRLLSLYAPASQHPQPTTPSSEMYTSALR